MLFFTWRIRVLDNNREKNFFLFFTKILRFPYLSCTHINISRSWQNEYSFLLFLISYFLSTWKWSVWCTNYSHYKHQHDIDNSIGVHDTLQDQLNTKIVMHQNKEWKNSNNKMKRVETKNKNNLAKWNWTLTMRKLYILNDHRNHDDVKR